MPLAGFLAVAHAQGPNPGETTAQDLNQLSLEELGNVKITTVSKDLEPMQKTPAAAYVITQDDIQRSGATSLPEALRLAPGVEVARIDADHWSVSVRGFAGQFSKSLLVLIDGRSVYTPLFSGVYWDAQNVMLADVDRIEVIRGPGGTIWGANAVNGVINIITKSASDTTGLLSNLGGGNLDQGVGNLRYGQTSAKGFSYRLYSMGALRGPEFHPDGNNFDRWRMGQAGFRADWVRGAKDSFTVQGDGYRGESGESLLLTNYSPLAEVAEQDKSGFAGGNLLARWEHKMGKGSDVQIQTYFDRTNRDSIELGETRNTFDVDYIQHARTYEKQELTWGLGARVSPDNVIQSSPSVNVLPNKHTDTIYSSFVQYELPFDGDRFTSDSGIQVRAHQFQWLRLSAERAPALVADSAPVRMAGNHPGSPDAIARRSGCAIQHFGGGHSCTAGLLPNCGQPEFEAGKADRIRSGLSQLRLIARSTLTLPDFSISTTTCRATDRSGSRSGPTLRPWIFSSSCHMPMSSRAGQLARKLRPPGMSRTSGNCADLTLCCTWI